MFFLNIIIIVGYLSLQFSIWSHFFKHNFGAYIPKWCLKSDLKWRICYFGEIFFFFADCACHPQCTAFSEECREAQGSGGALRVLQQAERPLTPQRPIPSITDAGPKPQPCRNVAASGTCGIQSPPSVIPPKYTKPKCTKPKMHLVYIGSKGFTITNLQPKYPFVKL